MVGIVWSFEQEEVDVMPAVTFFAVVQRNVATVVAAAYNVNTDRWVLFFELRDVFDGHREGEAGSV